MEGSDGTQKNGFAGNAAVGDTSPWTTLIEVGFIKSTVKWKWWKVLQWVITHTCPYIGHTYEITQPQLQMPLWWLLEVGIYNRRIGIILSAIA